MGRFLYKTDDLKRVLETGIEIRSEYDVPNLMTIFNSPDSSRHYFMLSTLQYNYIT